MDARSDDLFRIDFVTHADGVIKAGLFINAMSPVFKGHFPGQPVVPGACMLQIVKEVLESALGYTVQLKKANTLKFIGMINPTVTISVQLELGYKVDEDLINVSGKLSDGVRVCFKFQGQFLNRD